MHGATDPGFRGARDFAWVGYGEFVWWLNSTESCQLADGNCSKFSAVRGPVEMIFEWDSRLMVSIVLAGQPPLEKILAKGTCEEVAQRIDYYARLRLLSCDETAAYLKHRCAVAGDHDFPIDGAVQSLYEITRGNMRALDRLTLCALDEAVKASAAVVGSAHVIAARTHLVV